MPVPFSLPQIPHGLIFMFLIMRLLWCSCKIMPVHEYVVCKNPNDSNRNNNHIFSVEKNYSVTL
jgi:hypothetical protein